MKPLFLALSQGGARAASHAGVLVALEREGIPVAGIAGVSGGALVAAAWAGGADVDKLGRPGLAASPLDVGPGLGRGPAFRQQSSAPSSTSSCPSPPSKA